MICRQLWTCVFWSDPDPTKKTGSGSDQNTRIRQKYLDYDPFKIPGSGSDQNTQIQIRQKNWIRIRSKYLNHDKTKICTWIRIRSKYLNPDTTKICTWIRIQQNSRSRPEHPGPILTKIPGSGSDQNTWIRIRHRYPDLDPTILPGSGFYTLYSCSPAPSPSAIFPKSYLFSINCFISCCMAFYRRVIWSFNRKLYWKNCPYASKKVCPSPLKSNILSLANLQNKENKYLVRGIVAWLLLHFCYRIEGSLIIFNIY